MATESREALTHMVEAILATNSILKYLRLSDFSREAIHGQRILQAYLTSAREVTSLNLEWNQTWWSDQQVSENF